MSCRSSLLSHTVKWVKYSFPYSSCKIHPESVHCFRINTTTDSIYIDMPHHLLHCLNHVFLNRLPAMVRYGHLSPRASATRCFYVEVPFVANCAWPALALPLPPAPRQEYILIHERVAEPLQTARFILVNEFKSCGSNGA